MRNIPVIMYHCINNHPEKNPLGRLSFSSKQFEQHLKYFKKNNFSFLTFPELWTRALEDKLSGKKNVVLTFDDGYLDNLLVAADILDFYKARGTIFVNPDFAYNGPCRTINDIPDTWGYLNYSEMKELESRGIFDIQSHTMTHDHEFCGDKIIDFYTVEKFNKYYWLSWNLFKNDKPFWCQNIDKLKTNIPVGYPIFENNRAITVRKFIPNEDFIKKSIDIFNNRGENAINEVDRIENKGTFETKCQWRQRVKYELEESKTILENKLAKDIEFLCFPGGAYNDEVLDIASKCGYKAYMVSSKYQVGNNYKNLLKADGKILGLKRISFTKDYPSFLQIPLTDYLNCKFKVEAFMGYKLIVNTLRFGRITRNILKKREL